jgi:Spy/CpxP family protein refolding chaperone
MNESPTTPSPAPSWRSRLLKGAALSAVLAAGVATVQLLPNAVALAADGVAGMHGGHGPSAEMRERHAARMHDHMQRVLADVGASEAQRTKIDAIVKASMDAQHGDMERMHADMKLLKQLLVAPVIDTAKVTTVRAEQEQLAIQTTRRLTDTALAIARQLTPQQRQALGKEIDAMFERHHGPGGDGPFGEGPRGEGPRGEGPRGEGPRGEGPRGEGPRGEGPRGEGPRGEAPPRRD